jgi:hypothetical protein
MARSQITDLLQVYPFWLFDTGPFSSLSLPLLTPLFGFSTISAPEITTEFTEISEANWIFKKKILKKGDVSNMTLTRGVTFYDSDFWRWMISALTGNMTGIHIGPINVQVGGYTPRRYLMLIQFMAHPGSLAGVGGPNAGSIIGSSLTQLAFFGLGAALTGASLSSVFSLEGAITGAAGLLSAAGVGGAFEFVSRLPAKAWLLHQVMPARYKVGGDFDALSSAISIAELEIAVEMVEEISLAA